MATSQEASSLNDLIKQPNSQMCFVCGIENPIGLKLFFYEDSDGQVTATFTPKDEHQGYPGLLHGGIAAAVLDEVLGRVVIGRGVWLMTARMELRYKRMIPLGQPLTVVGRVRRETRRFLEAEGELLLADDSVAATATATYLPMPQDKLQDLEKAVAYWKVFPD
jgi:acyl-coenzyme A thioesterase PaaI-like protein